MTDARHRTLAASGAKRQTAEAVGAAEHAADAAGDAHQGGCRRALLIWLPRAALPRQHRDVSHHRHGRLHLASLHESTGSILAGVLLHFVLHPVTFTLCPSSSTLHGEWLSVQCCAVPTLLHCVLRPVFFLLDTTCSVARSATLFCVCFAALRPSSFILQHLSFLPDTI